MNVSAKKKCRPEQKVRPALKWRSHIFYHDFLKLLKICSTVLAERAYEIVRQFIAFVYISAYLAYPAF